MPTYESRVYRAHKPRVVLMALLLAALALPACGGDDPVVPQTDVSDTGGRGDGGAGGDSGDDSGLDADDPTPPVGEPLHIVYTQEATFPGAGMPAYRQLMVTTEDCRPSTPDLCEPGTCEPIEIAPRDESEPLCVVSCTVTDDLSAVVFLDATERETLRIATLGADLQIVGDSRIVATETSDFQVRGNAVAYRKGNDVHVFDSVAGTDRVVGTFARQGGGFHLASGGTKIFLNEVVSLTAMEVTMVDLVSGATSRLYRFVSGEPQGTGSFYSGRERMAVSPDGTRLAVLTSARTSSIVCNSNADCLGVGETCLLSAQPSRCVRHELSLNIINLAAANRLDEECASDTDCGDDHFCDLTAPNDSAQGRCMPGRFSLGPSGPTSCGTLQTGQYESVRGELAWRSDRTLLAVLSQSCIVGNINVTDLVALNLEGGAAFERVIENTGLDHGGCYDDIERCYRDVNCTIEISNAHASPSGNTSVLVADSFSSSLTTELWLADAYGREPKRVMTSSSSFDVHLVRVLDR